MLQTYFLFGQYYKAYYLCTNKIIIITFKTKRYEKQYLIQMRNNPCDNKTHCMDESNGLFLQ